MGQSEHGSTSNPNETINSQGRANYSPLAKWVVLNPSQENFGDGTSRPKVVWVVGVAYGHYGMKTRVQSTIEFRPSGVWGRKRVPAEAEVSIVTWRGGNWWASCWTGGLRVAGPTGGSHALSESRPL